MAGLDLGGKDAGPLVSRLDTYYEDPDLVKGKVSKSSVILILSVNNWIFHSTMQLLENHVKTTRLSW